MNSTNKICVDFKLTIPQYRFYASEARYRAFISGIGAGKTFVGLLAGIKEAVSQPGSIGMVIAPTYRTVSDIVYPELERLLPFEMIKNWSQSAGKLELVNGSEIRFRSAENSKSIERLRGPSIAWYFIDEASLMPQKVWDILIGRLRQPKYICKGFLATTPRGYNWVHTLFVARPIADSFVISGVASRSNIHLSEDYFASLESQYTGQFLAQELHGEFVTFEGLIYPGFTPDKIVREVPEHYDKLVYGVDWGFRNPSVVLAIGIKDKTAYVLSEFYKTRTTDEELIGIAEQMQQKFGVGPFFCDPSSPAGIEKFRRAGIDARKANNDVNGGIRAVTAWIETNRFFVHESCQNTISEFGMYQYADNEKDAPVKLYDHAMDAVRYAVMGAGGSGGDGYAEMFQKHPSLASELVFGGGIRH